MVNLVLETSQYQVFDMQYGVVLLDRTPNRDSDSKTFRNIFMQGDDANQFLAEVENIAKAKMTDSAMNYFFSAYDEITASYNTLEELDKIGITVRQTRQRKLK
jgi:hypothetical protein